MNKLNIPSWSKALGLGSREIEAAYRHSQPEKWIEESYWGYHIGKNWTVVTFRDGQVEVGLASSPVAGEERFDVGVTTDRLTIVKSQRQPLKLRAYTAGQALWRESSDCFDAEMAILALAMTPGTELTSLGEQRGPDVTFTGKISRKCDYLGFFELRVVDSQDVEVRVCVSKDDCIGEVGDICTFFGVVTATIFNEQDESFAERTGNFALPSPTPTETVNGVATLNYQSSPASLVGFEPATFVEAWEAMENNLIVAPGGPDFSCYRSDPDQGVFGINFSGDQAVSINVPAKQLRVIPGLIPYWEDGEDDEDEFWGGLLVATEGTFGYLPDAVEFDLPIEPTTYGEERFVAAQIKSIELESVWPKGSNVVSLCTEIDGKDTAILVSRDVADRVRDFLPGGFYVGRVMRVLPDDPFTADFFTQSTWAESVEEVREAVNKAIAEQRVLEMVYQDANFNRTQRRIYPFDNPSFDTERHFVAWDLAKADWRTFLINRVQACRVLSDKFDPNLVGRRRPGLFT
ncbi:hypothetical protein CKALI_03275 [Corynebacterium kalinowskii]|uniref:WYL domain-containing protein n=1 Tax=Corynebacterium kalinowskii TaxID=2675216 RepID=A0A6B8W1I3_9CORY|nr:WYL domain-containing protein [Corynebacterium kalinowskii]QGU01538.1 hypothetical protein CKALI_03275 [Corynebacterium kalinowskii]